MDSRSQCDKAQEVMWELSAVSTDCTLHILLQQECYQFEHRSITKIYQKTKFVEIRVKNLC
jgi:hypothetical protein